MKLLTVLAGAASALSLTLGLAGPALAQSDIVGDWAARQHEDAPERGEGPEIGDYVGTPINEASRWHADTFNASILTIPEHECFVHPADYGTAFTGVRISKDVDPVTQNVIAYHTNIAWMNPNRTIWMDGRPHPPPDAIHTWEGFSTGKWEGDMLTVTTTHLKTGYVKRNGPMRSDLAVITEHFIRFGNYLTWITVINDPVYLTEPLIRSRNYEFDPGFQVTLYPCSVDVEVPHPEGQIPHYLPGTNPDLEEYAQKHNLPAEVIRAGAESMYPEYQAQIKGGYVPSPAAAARAKAALVAKAKR